MDQHLALLSFLEYVVGGDFRASNHGLVFPIISSHPDATQESPHWSKRHSCHPGNPKRFRSPGSATGVKDQILKQKIPLWFLSCRKFQGCQELWTRNWGQRSIYTFSIISRNHCWKWPQNNYRFSGLRSSQWRTSEARHTLLACQHVEGDSWPTCRLTNERETRGCLHILTP